MLKRNAAQRSHSKSSAEWTTHRLHCAHKDNLGWASHRALANLLLTLTLALGRSLTPAKKDKVHQGRGPGTTMASAVH